MALLGAAALLLFGPEQLPRVARKAGNVMREIQNTSQSFIREMERAADLQDAAETKPPLRAAGVRPAALRRDRVRRAAAYDDAPAATVHAVEPPEPDPERPAGAGEKLAEPRPAPGLPSSRAAEPPPETDHPAHL